MYRASAMVVELAVLVLLAAALGGWIDGFLDTAPLFLLLSSFAALLAGVYRIIRTLETPKNGDRNP